MRAAELLDGDARFAIIFTLGSQTLKRFPLLDWLVVGPNHNVVPAGWRRLSKPAEKFEDHWKLARRDPNGPYVPIPRLYRRAGVLNIDRNSMDTARKRTEQGRDAIALRLGGQVVIGAMAAGESFSDDPYDDSVLHAAFRVNRNNTYVTPGSYSPTQGEFMPAESTLSGTVLVSEVSPEIPIL